MDGISKTCLCTLSGSPMEVKAFGKASTWAQNRYIAKAYDRINLTVAKGRKETIQTHAARSESVNGFIGRAIMETMERDSSGAAASGAVPAEQVLAGMPSGYPQKAVETAQGAWVISLPSDALETAQKAAERTGKAMTDFVARSVTEQQKRDDISFKSGINPTTGEKLNGGAEE